MPQAPKERDDDKQQVSLGLASLVAAATALVSGIGALTAVGVLGRVQRNHGAALGWAILFVVLGALLWLISSLVSSKVAVPVGKRDVGWRQLGFAVAGVVTVIGLYVGYHAAFDAAADTEEPAIELALDARTLAVTGRATVANLGSDERLAVLVDGAVRDGHGGWTFDNLSQSYRGPNGDGEANSLIEVGMPAGRFEAVSVIAYTGEKPGGCGEYTPRSKDIRDGGTACKLILLPAHPNPPQLAAWSEGAGRRRFVRLTVRTAGTGMRDVNPPLLVLRAVGLRRGERLQLYRAVVEPRPLGALRRTVRVPIPLGVGRICAQARFISAGDTLRRVRCPLHGVHVASAQMRVR